MRNLLSAGLGAWIMTPVVLLAAAYPQPVAAQSLLQSIFGFLGPQKKKPAEVRIIQRPAPVDRNHGFPRANPFQNGYQSYVPQRSGRLRTVCVRLCDGYYFPISNSSSRRDFYRDAQACQSRCQSETRLYHMPAATPSIKFARDRRGFAYKDLKTAFLYRKKLSKSCSCQPEPWTTAARLRHASYAMQKPTMMAEVSTPSTEAPATNSFAPAPHPVTQNDQPAETAPHIAVPNRYPSPALARRAPPPRPIRTARIKRRPIKKPAMGLGATFAGLPKVKYRHKWSNVLD